MPSQFKTKLLSVVNMAADAIANSATDETVLRITCNLHRFLQAELQEREIIEIQLPDSEPEDVASELKIVENDNNVQSAAPYNFDHARNTVDGDETITKIDAADPKLFSTLMSKDDTYSITRGEDPASFAPRFVEMKLGFWFGRGVYSWCIEDDRLRVTHD